MGATEQERRDVGYCVSAALVQLEDLEQELREEAFVRLARDAVREAMGEAMKKSRARSPALAQLSVALKALAAWEKFK